MTRNDFMKWSNSLETSGYNNRYGFGTCAICGEELTTNGKIAYCGQKNHVVIHENCVAFNGKGIVRNPNNEDLGEKASCKFIINNCNNVDVLIGFVVDSKYYSNLFEDAFKVEMPKQKSLSSISKWFDVLENNNISFTYELVVNNKPTTIEKACPKRVSK